MAGLTAPLLGLEKQSLREQASAALRTAITTGELEPGPPMSPKALPVTVNA